MDEPQIRLDGAQTIRNLLLSTFGSVFTTYYIGAPGEIPEAALPCVIIQRVHTSYRAGATMTDDVTEDIMVHILDNGKNSWGAPDDDDTAMRKLQNLVEGRDPVTGAPLKTSIIYALRQNITFTSTIIDNDIDVNYDVTTRPDAPTLVEAIITVKTVERVFLPNRT
jgi:hypothetical protein